MWTERLARGVVVLVVTGGIVSVAAGLLGLVWSPDLSTAPPEPCTDPPCLSLDLGGVSPLAILPFIGHLLLIGLALLVGGICLLNGVVAAGRGRGRRALALGAAAVVTPLVVLVGGEVLPHLLNPCVLPDLLEREPPGFCALTPEGADVPDRWHALDHALVGFLPLSLAAAWWWRRVLAGPARGDR